MLLLPTTATVALLLSSLMPLQVSAAVPEANGTLRVILRDHALASSTPLTLGDVADIVGGSPTEADRWNSLELGRIAPSGKPIFLERAAVERWARIQMGFSAKRAIWSGAGGVRIDAAIHRLAGADIARTAQDALTAELAAVADRVEVHLLATPTDINLPIGKVDMTARGVSDLQRLRRLLIWVDVAVDGHPITSIPVRLSVTAYRHGYIAKERLKVGRLVDASAFDQRDIDISDVAQPGLVVQEFRSDVPWRMRRPMTAGAVLTAADLESMPAVARGDLATLISVAGAVQLETRVEVLRDGDIGQQVPVKGTAGSGSIKARVVAPGILELRE